MSFRLCREAFSEYFGGISVFCDDDAAAFSTAFLAYCFEIGEAHSEKILVFCVNIAETFN